MKQFTKEEIITAYKVLSELEKSGDELKETFGKYSTYDCDGWRISHGLYGALTTIKNILANKIAYEEAKEK